MKSVLFNIFEGRFLFTRRALIGFTYKKSALFGTLLLFAVVLFCLFGPLFSSYSYYEIHLELKNMAPSPSFWFGSDELGRDVFTRVWMGGRISLFVGICAAVIDLIIGVAWGAVAGIYGGIIEETMMRLTDVLHGIPYLLTVILLMVLLGPGLSSILIALTLTGWINMARIVRSHILQLKEADFIYAAKAAGASYRRIIFKHLIPNTAGPIVATMMLSIPVAIFSEAFLSFLGLGVQAPVASWGVMINDSLPAMRYYPWRLFFPGLLIVLTMLSFHLIGEGMQEAFNPRKMP